jgi:hypothetical protein
MFEERVQELKEIIASNDGRNAADARFARAVDDLVSSVYDDISDVCAIPARALFDLFVIKVLYVGLGSRHADVVEYLGALLERCLDARELFPADEHGRPRQLYFSDLIDPDRTPPDVENVFDAYRQYADSALFLSGMFPARTAPRRRASQSMLGRPASRGLDAAYYVTTGKTMYRMAARDQHASCEHAPDTLDKLADHFEVYVGALNEMSSRYILGFDATVIADHMLDSHNAFRASGDRKHAANMARYAELLAVDPTAVAPRHEAH